MTSTVTDRLNGLTTSLAVKAPCRVATTANITLSGLQTINGVTVVENDRVLVWQQTDSSENGIYNASSGDWTRAKDFDGNRDVVQGTIVPVVNGSSGANLYEVTASNPITIGTTDITFSLRYGANTRYDQTPAEIAAGVTPVDYAYPFPNDPRRMGMAEAPYLNLLVKGLQKYSIYGAVGDGAADDTAALNRALTDDGRIIEIEAGTYKFTSNLSVPTCQMIVGQGEDVAILKPSSAVTKALSIGHASHFLRKITGFRIDGTNTTAAVGLFLGDAASWAGDLDHVRISNFIGSNARGLRIGDVLKSKVSQCIFDGSTVNVRAEQVSSGFPTTITIVSSVLTDATAQNLSMVDGEDIHFLECDFESAAQQGVLILVAASHAVRGAIFDSCWFEDNYSNADPSFYMFEAGAGTDPGSGAEIDVELRNPRFSLGASTAKAINFNGAHVSGNIHNPKLKSVIANCIAYQNNAYGVITGWTNRYDFATSVLDGANKVFCIDAPWKDFVPTYASSVGNAAASFTGAVTTTNCRFRRIGGKTVALAFDITAQLQAVTPSYITATLPSGITPLADQSVGITVTIAGTQRMGKATVGVSDSKLYIRRDDVANFSSGALVQFTGNLTFEIA